MKQKFDVTGMTCSACSAHVEKAVNKLEGVRRAEVSLMTNSMTVQYDEDVLSPGGIIDAVIHAGYGASLPETAAVKAAAARPEARLEEELSAMKHRLIWSFVFLVPLFYISMGHMMGAPLPSFLLGMENAVAFGLTQLLLTLPIMYLNDKYYQVGFQTLLHRAPNMDSLIAVGSAAAVVYGVFAIYQMGYGLGHGDLELAAQYHMDLYFESAGMILTLITLGKFLETRSKGKTSQAITRLMDLAPKTAAVLRDGQEVEIPVEEVRVGDRIVVRPGQSIPVDGVIVEGSSAVDESALTGESIPVDKGPGDTVAAAAINRSGSFTFEASRVGEDTTLAQMIRLVEEASSSKAPISKLADKVAGVFVPVVMAIAAVTALVWFVASGYDVTRALTAGVAVLVISCPCALGLATPVAIMVGTGKGAENGILIKSGEALETAHAIDTVVMDKTGTITEGRPKVTDIIALTGSDEELVTLAAALEKGSEHPLAEAITTYAADHNLTGKTASDFKALFGRGVQAVIDGKTYYAGNTRLMDEVHIDTAAITANLNTLADDGKTPLLFANEKEIIGIIAVADVEKETSAEAIADFAKMGINVVMLTGDNQRTAEAIRQRLHIPQVIAGVLPQDKEKHIAALQAEGHKVAMIGDGINDAPALAKADLGMAIGAGTDVAIESADAVLMRSDLLDAVSAIRLSKAVIKNIKENLFWAFFYNVICIPLAAGLLYPAFGIRLSPMIGAAAMSLSSFTVCMNALRLRFFQTTHSSRVSRETRINTSQPAVTTAEPKAAVAATTSVSADHTAENKTTVSNEPQKGNDETMEKTLKIEGMMCQHCQNHVHEALSAMDGVTAVTVDLEGKKADVTLSKDIPMDDFAKVIADAGYELVK